MLVVGDEVYKMEGSSVAAAVTCAEDFEWVLVVGDEVHQIAESSVAAAVTCAEKALMGCDQAQRISFTSYGNALTNAYSNPFDGCWPNAHTGPIEPLVHPWKYTRQELKLIPNTKITMHTYSHATFVTSPVRSSMLTVSQMFTDRSLSYRGFVSRTSNQQLKHSKHSTLHSGRKIPAE